MSTHPCEQVLSKFSFLGNHPKLEIYVIFGNDRLHIFSLGTRITAENISQYNEWPLREPNPCSLYFSLNNKHLNREESQRLVNSLFFSRERTHWKSAFIWLQLSWCALAIFRSFTDLLLGDYEKLELCFYTYNMLIFNVSCKDITGHRNGMQTTWNLWGKVFLFQQIC